MIVNQWFFIWATMSLDEKIDALIIEENIKDGLQNNSNDLISNLIG